MYGVGHACRFPSITYRKYNLHALTDFSARASKKKKQKKKKTSADRVRHPVSGRSLPSITTEMPRIVTTRVARRVQRAFTREPSWSQLGLSESCAHRRRCRVNYSSRSLRRAPDTTRGPTRSHDAGSASKPVNPPLIVPAGVPLAGIQVPC